MENDHRHHLFVIRIWYEPSRSSGGQWRGSVEHVPSGQRMYFVALHDLVDFIVLRSGQPDAAQPDMRVEREQ